MFARDLSLSWKAWPGFAMSRLPLPFGFLSTGGPASSAAGFKVVTADADEFLGRRGLQKKVYFQSALIVETPNKEHLGTLLRGCPLLGG